jgi:ATP-dependent helicase YprA (DUF1998 family)
MPVLDHCARARDVGQRGIKAIFLYPMNAHASDQARRLAELIHSEQRLGGIRAGIYVGDNGGHADMGRPTVAGFDTTADMAASLADQVAR